MSTLAELQEKLNTHQKEKERLENRFKEAIQEFNQLKKELEDLSIAGQLVQGGIALLDSLINEEKSDAEAE
jgi:predicted nuclease with TOPRIM domain